MAHYTVDLPGNINVEVRKGKVFKKGQPFLLNGPG